MGCFDAWCLCHEQDARVRSRALEQDILRRRIYLEKRLKFWQLWWLVEHKDPGLRQGSETAAWQQLNAEIAMTRYSIECQ